MLTLCYSKPIHNILNYASTANIEEVMKFYNLGDKTFETDFSYCVLSIPGRKIDSQPSTVSRLVLLPTSYCYGCDVTRSS